MTDYEKGFNEARERAAQVAENYYTGIIRCKKSGNIEHVRLHVEYQWSAEVARRIRTIEH